MPNYHSKHELSFFNAQVEGHKQALEVWKETCTNLNAHHEKNIHEWQKQHDNDEMTAETEEPPTPPMLPYEPEAPDSSSLKVYESRVAEEIEELEMATGNILVMPGRVILETVDGDKFSVSEQELAHNYILVEDVSV